MSSTSDYRPVVDGGVRRYTAAARWFHWVTALLLFTVIPLGWIFAEFKTKDAAKEIFEAPLPGIRDGYASVHKTLGLLIFAIVVARILYRLLNRPPALPSRLPAIETGLAHATHWLLYLVLVVMPISGYIASSAGKHPISILGLFDVPKLPIGKEQGEIAESIHVYTQFAVYLLVVLHLGGVAVHVFARRDGVLDRMLPRQRPID